LGLLPWQAERINPAEAQALYVGQQRRFNRDARVVAWFLAMLRPMMAWAVTEGIARAFGEKPQVKPIDMDALLKTMPGYEEEDE
jgi:hypothetical protein